MILALGGASFAEMLERQLARLRLTAPVRVELYQMVSALAGMNLAPEEILKILYLNVTEEGRRDGGPLAVALRAWRTAILNGEDLADAMEGWLPDEERLILAAGVRQGDIAAACDKLVFTIDSMREIRRSLKSARTYPFLMILLVLGVSWVLGAYIIPVFQADIPAYRWTGPASSLLVFAWIAENAVIPAVLLWVACVIGYRIACPRWTGRGRVIADRFIPFSFYRLLSGAGFLMALGALTAARHPPNEAIRRLRAYATPYLRERLDGILENMANGDDFAVALWATGTGWPDPRLVRLLRVFAQSADLEKHLDTMAERWLRDSRERIAEQIKVARTVSTLVIMALVLWIIVGFGSLLTIVRDSIGASGF